MKNGVSGPIVAGTIAKLLFDRFLHQRKGKGNGCVIFTGGGTGSGKSSMMNHPVIENADFVFDSTMVNYEAAKNSLEKVIANGQIPVLAFVYRDPVDAWFHGVQKRNQNKDGHIVPETVFANTHAVARETFLRLVDEFYGKLKYIIQEVESGKDAFEISIEELKKKPKYTKEQIKEAIHAGTYTGAKRFLEKTRSAGGTDSDAVSGSGSGGKQNRNKTDIAGFPADRWVADGRRGRRISEEDASRDTEITENSDIRFSLNELESKTDELHKKALKDGVIRRIAEIAADAFQYFKRKVPNDYMVRTNLCVTA